MSKNLINITLIHDPITEAGKSLLPGLQEKLTAIDTVLIDRSNHLHDDYWEQVEKYLQGFNINRIYQDSVVKEILTDVKNCGEPFNKSRNLSLVKKLIKSGSILEPTESLDLLLDFFYKTREGILDLTERDKYIVDNIAETLQERETGVLFIGIKHQTKQILEQKYPNIHIYRMPIDTAPLLDVTREIYLQCYPFAKDKIMSLF
jgi:hypothetical protein